MQALIGIVILIIVCYYSVDWAEYKVSGNSRIRIFGSWLFHFFTRILTLYALLAIVCSLIWIVVEIGIYLREIMLWFIDAVMYPFIWIF